MPGVEELIEPSRSTRILIHRTETLLELSVLSCSLLTWRTTDLRLGLARRVGGIDSVDEVAFVLLCETGEVALSRSATMCLLDGGRCWMEATELRKALWV